MKGKKAENRETATIVTAANGFTLLRVMLVPLAAWFFVHGNYIQTAVTMGFAGATDILDGWIARRTGTATRFGATFDVIADCIAVFTMQGLMVLTGSWPPILVVLSVCSLCAFALCSGARKRPCVLGKYVGAVLLSTCILAAVCNAIDRALWDDVLAIVAVPVAAYICIAVIENLCSVAQFRRNG